MKKTISLVKADRVSAVALPKPSPHATNTQSRRRLRVIGRRLGRRSRLPVGEIGGGEVAGMMDGFAPALSTEKRTVLEVSL
jgi:hypothetical protein